MPQQEYFLKRVGNKMGIETADGKGIVKPIYDFVTTGGEGSFVVSLGDKHGFVDLEGNEFIPLSDEREYFEDFSEGLAMFYQNNGYGFIDKKGKVIIEPVFYSVDSFKDGVARVRNEKNLYGFIDKMGTMVLDYRYSVVSNFENGYARFGRPGGLLGLISKKGEVVLEEKFLYIGDVEDNKMVVRVREGEDYKEGVLTLGQGIQWNNNMDALNEGNRRIKRLEEKFRELLVGFYKEACPCQYERFRNYIIWEKDVRFLDQEILYDKFRTHLKLNENRGEGEVMIYQCPTCQTLYEEKWHQLIQVMKVRIVSLNIKKEIGPPPVGPYPVVLGFRLADEELLKVFCAQYKTVEMDVLIHYLKERI